MLKKILSASVLIALMTTGGIANAAETKTTCDVCGFQIITEKFEDVPSSITQNIKSYVKPKANQNMISQDAIQVELRNILVRLESQGIDSRSLFGGKKFPFYVTDAFFDGYSAFAVWRGMDSNSTAVVMGGKDEYLMLPPGTEQAVAHEFGHMIDHYYFDVDPDLRDEYRKLRGIPIEWNNSMEWNHRPVEVFAEDFAQLFGEPKDYFNKTELGKMNEEQQKNIKALIVKTIKSKQNEIKFDSKDQSSLYELRQMGIIPADRFLLCEMPIYGNVTITNKEFINWMFALIQKQTIYNSFADLKLLTQAYENVNPLYTNNNLTTESALDIMGGFVPLIDTSKARTLDIPTFALTNYTKISREEAALIVANFIK